MMIKNIFVFGLTWVCFFFAHAQTINDIFEKGIKLQQEGKLTEAIAKFSDVVKKDKFYHEAWFNRAICYTEQKKYDLAISDLSEAIKAKKDFSRRF